MPLANVYINRDAIAQQALDYINNHPALPFKGTNKWQDELVTLTNGNKVIWAIPEDRLNDMSLNAQAEKDTFYSSPLAPDEVREVEQQEIEVPAE